MELDSWATDLGVLLDNQLFIRLSSVQISILISRLWQKWPLMC